MEFLEFTNKEIEAARQMVLDYVKDFDAGDIIYGEGDSVYTGRDREVVTGAVRDYFKDVEEIYQRHGEDKNGTDYADLLQQVRDEIRITGISEKSAWEYVLSELVDKIAEDALYHESLDDRY